MHRRCRLNYINIYQPNPTQPRSFIRSPSFHLVHTNALNNTLTAVYAFISLSIACSLDICWNNNCWGFPRLLTSGTFREKEDLVVMLMTAKDVVSEPVMRRVFALANAIGNTCCTVTIQLVI